MRTIAVMTGTRAEYGLLSGLLDAVERERGLKLRLIVTGQHLMPEFGNSVREITRAGRTIAARVRMPLRRDTGLGVAEALADGVRGLAKALRRLEPDVLVLLGDRFETLAAACAALPLKIPVAHIHGGEATEGVIDEQIRHAVTKLSHLHFPAAKPFRRRILRLGEDPRRVFCFGAPGLDGLSRKGHLPERELRRDLGVPDGLRLGSVTFHPATLERGTAGKQTRALAEALARRDDFFWVWSMPGAEEGYREVVREARAFVRRRPGRAALYSSLGRARYLSLLRHADLVVGNSSSGLLETPTFGVPAVDVGDRQRGRLRAGNVVSVPVVTARTVSAGIAAALSPAFRRKARAVKNPYRGRDTCARIARVLRTVPLGEALLKKSFTEAP